jgi:hypothetical protein
LRTNWEPIGERSECAQRRSALRIGCSRTWNRSRTAGSRGAPIPEGNIYRLSPEGGQDKFWQTSADGLFIVQLQAALAYFEAAVEVRGP